MREENLIIRKASAGAGKTYALAQHYLKLVLKTKDLKAFTKIIAMTFTNKAAIEMKERIISNLVTLSYLDESDAKEVQFLNNTATALKMAPSLVRERAQNVLKSILHNYGELSIMTIDKFNVRLVRTFTKDLDLPADFEIILKTSEFYELVIDKLIDSVGRKGAEQISKMLIEFSKQNIDDQKKWNFRDSLLKFIEEIEKEKNIPIINDLKKHEYNEEKKAEIFSSLHKLENQYEAKKSEFCALFYANNWSKKDFEKGLVSVYRRIDTIKDKGLSEIEDLTEKMHEAIQDEYRRLRTSIPTDFIRKIEAFYNWVANKKEQYNMLQYVKNSFYLLALLKRIDNLLKETQKTENAIRINEFNKLIFNLIQSESAPYIYERIGTRFNHYLLDEFQDTSRLQWQNLIPLVHDSLGNGNSNFIVGDVKQAIYRFNNGLVEQFAALPKIYNPEKLASIELVSNFFESTSNIHPLVNNYRSKKEIVTFNNMLFSLIKNNLNNDYQKYYNNLDLKQTPIKEEGGLVCVQKNKDASDFVLNSIQACLDDGFAPKDICLILDRNKEAVEWAQFLINKGHKVISALALSVRNSDHVKCFVQYLRYRNQPTQISTQLIFIESYYALKKVKNTLKNIDLFKEISPKNPINVFAEQEFENKNALDFSYENLYDLSQKLILLMELNEMKDPYLHHFCDMLQTFDLKNGPDIQLFLEYYDGKGQDESVVLSEASNAIRIITGHKSKGLEFPVVILPSLKWAVGFSQTKSKLLFSDSNHNEIYIAGIGTKKNSTSTNYQVEQNLKEVESIVLDKINLLYVACTRPTERLYISTEKETSKSTIAKFFNKSLDEIHLLKKIDEDTYCYGKREKKWTIKSNQKDTIFNPVTQNNCLWFPDISLIDKASLATEDLNEQRRFGTQFHLLLSELNTPTDLEKTLIELSNNNQIEPLFMSKIKEQIAMMLDKKELLDLLFPQQNEVLLNEREIVIEKGEKIRPDRVILSEKNARIIDFKTGLPQKKDHKQVSIYKEALSSMGYSNCNAFLVYTDQQKIVPVA